MTEDPHGPDLPSSADHDVSAEGVDPLTPAPRWVKVFGFVTIAVVLLFLILLLSGRGHGPGRHFRHGDADGNAPRSSATGDHPPSAGAASPRGGRRWA